MRDGDTPAAPRDPAEPEVGTGDGTKQSPYVYAYENPAEPLHGTPKPQATELLDVGPSKSHPAGSREHMIARWSEYLDKKNGGGLSWDKWRDLYIRNQGHHARGVAFESAYFDVREPSAGWLRNESVQQLTGVNRNYDGLLAAEQRALEMKSGGGIDSRQLVKDKELVDAGWEIKYVFGKPPKPGTIRKLAEAGIEWEVFFGQAVIR